MRCSRDPRGRLRHEAAKRILELSSVANCSTNGGCTFCACARECVRSKEIKRRRSQMWKCEGDEEEEEGNKKVVLLELLVTRHE